MWVKAQKKRKKVDVGDTGSLSETIRMFQVRLEQLCTFS